MLEIFTKIHMVDLPPNQEMLLLMGENERGDIIEARVTPSLKTIAALQARPETDFFSDTSPVYAAIAIAAEQANAETVIEILHPQMPAMHSS